MKEYPSIPANDYLDLPCIAFDKLDGSNLRFRWRRKKGWYMSGTRHRMFDKNDPEFGCAIDIFMEKYASHVEKKVFKHEEVICFCEFLGPHSFAGVHDSKHHALQGVTHNDPKDLILFDVNIHKRGFVPPEQFVEEFGDLHIPRVIYRGDLTEEFIEKVRAGEYPVFEGVICKGVNGKLPHGLWMRKIKTNHYKEELKRRFKQEWQKYE